MTISRFLRAAFGLGRNDKGTALGRNDKGTALGRNDKGRNLVEMTKELSFRAEAKPESRNLIIFAR